MKYGVAIWADRTKVVYRIHLVSFPHFGYRGQMMYVDIAFHYFSIGLAEIKTADIATDSVVLDTPSTCSGVTLIGIHVNSASRALQNRRIFGKLFRQRYVRRPNPTQPRFSSARAT